MRIKRIFSALAVAGLLLPVMALAQNGDNLSGPNSEGGAGMHGTSTLPGGRGPGLLGHLGENHGTSTMPFLTGMGDRFNHATGSMTSLKSSEISGTVAAAPSGTTITLTGSDGTAYIVDASSAKIMRKYGATMQVSDIQVGDSLMVAGTVSGTNITAKNIRDNSQQQRNANFSGSVTAVSSSGFTLQSKDRGNQTVNTTSTTVFKQSGQTSVSLSNVAVGQNVEVMGVWDSTNNVVTAATVVIVVRNGSWSGTLASLPSGSTLTITGSNNTTYTVDATNAKLIRHYGAPMQLSDYQQGDKLSVNGTLNGTTITAKTVRDDSLQARYGSFSGSVTAVSSSGFILQSKDRGSQTINTSSTTIFRLGSKTASLSDIAVGQNVEVSGVWDRVNTNVTANRVTIKVMSTTMTGTFVSAQGTMLTITDSNNTTYTVDASKAVFVFRGNRKGDISMLVANDHVQIRGTMISGSTTITASYVRDLSQTMKGSATTNSGTPPHEGDANSGTNPPPGSGTLNPNTGTSTGQ